MGSEGEWEELVEAIAQELIPFLQRGLHGAHLDRMRARGVSLIKKKCESNNH